MTIPELIIRTPQVKQAANGSLVTTAIDCPEGRFDLFFEITGAAVASSATPFAMLCLPLVMARGWTLRSELPVSSRLLKASATIQDIYRFFLPGTRRIQIDVPAHEEPISFGRTCACFFSGGVDSYYTFLKHRQRITRLIFSMGFDFRLSQANFTNIALEQMRQSAHDLGAGLIEVKSNIRDFSDRFVHWRYFIGAALGATASLLAAEVDTAYIGSSQHYGDLFNWGTHPILDPLFSTEAVEVINDGCEATRLEKLTLVAKNDVALKSLRVCFNNKNDRYNCNHCEKCLRTKVGLYLLGALDRCESLDHDLYLDEISRLHMGDNPIVMRINQENYDFVRKHRLDPRLEKAIRLGMRKTSWLKKARKRVRSCFTKPPVITVLGARPSDRHRT